LSLKFPGKIRQKAGNLMTALERNPGIPLDLGWACESNHVNPSAVERRASTLTKRRSVKKEWQAAWLLKAVALTDLTTLAGDDTPGNVRRLCAKARQPVRQDLLEQLGLPRINVGAVCVYHTMIPVAVEALKGTNIPVAAVSTGFPAAQNPPELRVKEIEMSVAAGAKEIDIVITRSKVLRGEWDSLYAEVQDYRRACGDAHLKTILATGELDTLRNVRMASLVCMMAGADFIKTSTGKEKVNATLPYGIVMARAIRDYEEKSGYKVGLKPAGGIRAAKDALNWLILVKDELGDAWLQPELFRLGASALIEDIERQLSHFVTGRYAARHHMPMG
jgi:deoxyribose-phosphate aldolase